MLNFCCKSDAKWGCLIYSVGVSLIIIGTFKFILTAFWIFVCSSLSSLWPFITSMALFEEGGGGLLGTLLGVTLFAAIIVHYVAGTCRLPGCLCALPGDGRTGFDPTVRLRVTAHNLHAFWPLAQTRTIKNQSGCDGPGWHTCRWRRNSKGVSLCSNISLWPSNGLGWWLQMGVGMRCVCAVGRVIYSIFCNTTVML